MIRKISVAGLLIGLGLLITAAVIGFDAVNMRVPPVHARIGPRVFPIVVACGLAASGLLLLLQARQGKFPEAEGTTDWSAVGIIAAGLLLHANLLKPLGFLPAGLILFMCVSIAFGSRAYLRDGLIALGVVGLTYFGFTQGLGLQLPAGLLGAFG